MRQWDLDGDEERNILWEMRTAFPKNRMRRREEKKHQLDKKKKCRTKQKGSRNDIS